ncbi:MAG: UDP-glucose/GDP-mannose dehydrogenase family protein [Roseiarcus sp.]|jgi:UDPglucose 6-dehydrogenase
MRIAMIGTGYVGLVSGACLCDFGHEVVCIDHDAAKIAALRGGEIPIYEPGLAEVVANNLAAGRLSFTTTLAEGAHKAQAIFIAVGTPTLPGEERADLSYVHEAARQIAGVLGEDYAVVVDKSTVPVGTGDEVERIIAAAAPHAKFSVVSNPEFLREGSAIKDFKLPDRIVVGVEDERARQVMAEIYRPLYLNQGPVMFTGRRTAEVIKYAANAFLAMKVTFINEIANLCEAVGADVQDVARGIGLDNRIGTKFLNAGPGFGGSCFPKDMLALAATAREAREPLRIIETVIDVNDRRKLAMADKIVRACGGDVRGKTIAVLGLTFKPNTDDMRSAPSLTIVPALQAAGAKIIAYDPKGAPAARALLPGVAFAAGPYDCAAGADALVIITEWEAFRALDLPRVKASMRTPVVIDLRNIYRPDQMAAIGFVYESVGRGAGRAR